MAKLKFGSPAWRKKYMKKKRTNPDYHLDSEHTTRAEADRRAKQIRKEEGLRAKVVSKSEYKGGGHSNRYWQVLYANKSRTNKPKRSNGRTSRKTRAEKRKRMRQMIAEANKIRKNPPRKWMNVRAVRVVRKNGRDILEVKR